MLRPTICTHFHSWFLIDLGLQPLLGAMLLYGMQNSATCLAAWRKQMKRLLVVTLLAFPMVSAQAQVESLSLDHGWQFRQSSPALPQGPTAEWRPAIVPGDVHLDLINNKLIADPFFGANEAKLQWISDADWEYRTELTVPASLASRKHLELVFDGLDTYALVYLNGQQVLTANNQFRIWHVDAKALVHAGTNELRVVFPAQDKAAETIARRDPWFGRNTVGAKSYIRKAAYEHGWDWGPSFVTSGIWRPAHLDGWDTARIADLHVRQSDVASTAAHLTAEVEVIADGDGTGTLELIVTPPGGASPQRQTRNVVLHGGSNTLTFPVDLTHPQLWFPAGYGAQPLYTVTARLHLRDGHGDDQRTVRVGLRSLQLRREVDKWGRSFEFVINGIPVYAKGANVIPSDSFPNRVTREKLRAMLQSAKDANMNMVRLWGGGYYEPDDFYDLCDELGILIWHDFMFGGEWQPGTYDFRQSVEQEARDQLTRLRNHPSIVLWCGNNEIESGFHSKDRDKLDPPALMRLWQDYLVLFHGTLARSVAQYDPEVPYWPSSPSADLEATTPEYRSGDDHVWDVWHGRMPFSTYETNHSRFVSEYGFQSFPQLSTVESFTTPADRTSIFTPVMLAHQKSGSGNELIQTYMLRDYTQPKDFESFLYVSQVLQAEGIKIDAEHLRRQRPRNMGSIYWQLNDCWPVASWSSIDSFGHWKALQYYARRFYAAVFVSPHLEDGRLAVYAVSDRTTPRTGTLTLTTLHFDGTVVATKTMPVTLPPLSSTMLYVQPVSEMPSAGSDLTRTFVDAKLVVEGEPSSENLTYLVPTKQVHLPPAHVTVQVEATASGSVAKVHTDQLARSVLLASTDAETTFQDNYFDLLPGETRTVALYSRINPKQLQDTLKVRSLESAFEPE
jgi:beta-mannosidase